MSWLKESVHVYTCINPYPTSHHHHNHHHHQGSPGVECVSGSRARSAHAMPLLGVSSLGSFLSLADVNTTSRTALCWLQGRRWGSVGSRRMPAIGSRLPDRTAGKRRSMDTSNAGSACTTLSVRNTLLPGDCCDASSGPWS